MDGNYEEAVRLMGSDERIIKYLKLFQKDTNIYVLCSAVKDNDFKTAFHAAHTLKGVALNLSLTSLADRTKELTEMLRSGIPGEGVVSLLQKTKKTHALVMECINTLINE
ncbi:Hpt domain-containing protein [Clostridium sp. MCC353]|uniref:Hpt domain-containing protein n=1 Tax=Clostridium sp. MCC353 TaxID=2592646 RepID=UPI001C00ED5F|nr:Hpt domain-containing protein [Clostridium sp. MCC353]